MEAEEPDMEARSWRSRAQRGVLGRTCSFHSVHKLGGNPSWTLKL